jgi:hypothetical protein
MKRLVRHAQIVAILALTLFAGASALSQSPRSSKINSKQSGTPYVDRQVIVKLDDDALASEAVVVRNSLKARVLAKFPSIGAELWQISGETVEAAVARYRRDPRIKYIEPNYEVALIDERPRAHPTILASRKCGACIIPDKPRHRTPTSTRRKPGISKPAKASSSASSIPALTGCKDLAQHLDQSREIPNNASMTIRTLHRRRARLISSTMTTIPLMTTGTARMSPARLPPWARTASARSASVGRRRSCR